MTTAEIREKLLNVIFQEENLSYYRVYKKEVNGIYLTLPKEQGSTPKPAGFLLIKQNQLSSLAGMKIRNEEGVEILTTELYKDNYDAKNLRFISQ